MASGEPLRELFVAVGVNIDGADTLKDLQKSIDQVAKAAADTSGLEELDKSAKKVTDTFKFSQDQLEQFAAVLAAYNAGDVKKASELLGDFSKSVEKLSSAETAKKQIEDLQKALEGGNLKDAGKAISTLGSAFKTLQGDAEKPKDAIEAIGKVLDSLARGEVGKAVEGFSALSQEFKGLALAAKGFVALKLGKEVAGTLTGMANSAADTASRLKEQAVSLRTTTQGIQEAEIVVKRFGGNADNVAQIMENFIGMANRAMTGSGGDIGLLGVLKGKPGQDPVALLATFADGLERLPVHLRDIAAERAGLKEMMPLLRMGGDYIRQQGEHAKRTAAIWNDDTIKAGVELKRALAGISAEFDIMEQALQARLMPLFRDVAAKIRALVVEVSQTLGDFNFKSERLAPIVEELIALIEILAVMIGLYTVALNANRVATLAWGVVARGIPAMLTMITTAVRALTIAMTAAVAPPAAVAAAIALLGTGALLVLEDLKVFSEDGESYFGDLFAAADGKLRPITDFFGDMQENIGSLIDWLKQLPDVFVESITKMGKMNPALKGMADMIESVAEKVGLVDHKGTAEEENLTMLAEKVTAIREEMQTMTDEGDLEGAAALQGNLRGATMRRDEALGKMIATVSPQEMAGVLERIGDEGLTAAAERASQSTTYSGTVNVGDVNMTVQANDPVKAGRQAQEAIDKMLADNARKAAQLARGRGF